ncbi:MAG TPA: sigma-70 family RNA polymerase sigma factor [Solirubrobacteraceae bacterium]|nr:sigma-70 family RNA polymerase sigma factor [Solirubrobacteraceae bacterium]
MIPSVSVRLLLSQSDERLVGYARAGHERAFEALVQRYRRQLLAYCRRLLLSEQRAEDALQQALLQAWVALRNGNEVSEPRAWLYRIVHNAAVQTLRVSRYDYCQLSESLSGADAPQADLERRIAVREALAGLAALPEMQREALLRTAIEGHTHQQAAADLGLSEPALRGLVYRARASLRAAAGAIVPPPLLSWALEAGTRGTPVLERAAGIGAGGGSAGLAGLLLKGGAVAVTAGALAGGIVANHERHAIDRHPRTAKPDTADSKQLTTAGAVQPVAFTRLDDFRATSHPRSASSGSASSPKNEARRNRPKRVYAPPTTRPRAAADNPPTPIADRPAPQADDRPRHDYRGAESENDGGNGDGHSSSSGISRENGGQRDRQPNANNGGEGTEPSHEGSRATRGGGGGAQSKTSAGPRTSRTGQNGSGNGSRGNNRDGKDSSTRRGRYEPQSGNRGGGANGREDRETTTASSQQQSR